jgi:polyphosphate kinase 2 (PPK2 family)
VKGEEATSSKWAFSPPLKGGDAAGRGGAINKTTKSYAQKTFC